MVSSLLMERQHNPRKEIIKSRCKFTCGQANLSEHVFSMRQIVLEVKRLAGAFLPKSNLVTDKAPYFKEGHDVKLAKQKCRSICYSKLEKATKLAHTFFGTQCESRAIETESQVRILTSGKALN